MDVFQTRFNGIRDDVGVLYVAPTFLRECENVSFDDLDGANKILFPEDVTTTEIVAGYDIDGIYEYQYLDSNNVLQKLNMCVTGGGLYKNWDTTPVLVYSGLTANKKCSFTTFKDKLWITNGYDNTVIYSGELNFGTQIGAPWATVTTNLGSPNGTYYYAIGYVTSGGTEILGTHSAAVTTVNSQILLTLPIGYDGTTQRKIYRTINGDANTYYLLTTVANNTDLTYTDNSSDYALTSVGSVIPATNNEMPKCYFVTSSYDRIVLGKADKYPTQLFVGDTGIEMIDPANYSAISDLADDNTEIIGMAQQFSKVVIASKKNWYTATLSDTSVTVDALSVNIGAWAEAGHSLMNVPKNATFPGGVMFLSALGDIRCLNGLASLIPNTLNNIDSENLAQQIRGTLDTLVAENIVIDAEYFNYTYHILLGSYILTYNTKNNGWSKLNLLTNDETTITPNCFGVVNNSLYIGLKGSSKILKMYSDTQYNGEDYTALVRTSALPTVDVGNGSFAVTQEYKFIEQLTFYFIVSGVNNLQYTVWLDSDYNNPITGTFTLSGGFYDPNFYSNDYYSTGTADQYRVLRINRYARWIEFELKSTSGPFYFRGYRLKYEPKPSKEI